MPQYAYEPGDEVYVVDAFMCCIQQCRVIRPLGHSLYEVCLWKNYDADRFMGFSVTNDSMVKDPKMAIALLNQRIKEMN